MFVHLPYGHTEVRVDARDPRKLGPRASLDVIRKVREERS
jgi:hypothetical protein